MNKYLTLLAITVLAALALGDTVYLKDGRKFEGIATKEGDKIVITIPNAGKLDFPAKDVIAIDISTQPATKPTAMTKAATSKPARPAENTESLWGSWSDVTLGDSIKKYPDMIPLFKSSSEYYRRESDKLSVGGAKLKSITYRFENGSFSGLVVECSGLVNYTVWKKAVFATYGKMEPSIVTSPQTAGEDYYLDKNSFICSFEFNKEKGVGRFIIMSRNKGSKDTVKENNTVEYKGLQAVADAQLLQTKGDYDKAIVILERLLNDSTIDSTVRLLGTQVLTQCYDMKKNNK